MQIFPWPIQSGWGFRAPGSRPSAPSRSPAPWVSCSAWPAPLISAPRLQSDWCCSSWERSGPTYGHTSIPTSSPRSVTWPWPQHLWLLPSLANRSVGYTSGPVADRIAVAWIYAPVDRRVLEASCADSRPLAPKIRHRKLQRHHARVTEYRVTCDKRVGVGRFELPASPSRTKRAAKLRYTPARADLIGSARDLVSLADSRACSCTPAQVPGPAGEPSRDRAKPG